MAMGQDISKERQEPELVSLCEGTQWTLRAAAMFRHPKIYCLDPKTVYNDSFSFCYCMLAFGPPALQITVYTAQVPALQCAHTQRGTRNAAGECMVHPYGRAAYVGRPKIFVLLAQTQRSLLATNGVQSQRRHSILFPIR